MIRFVLLLLLSAFSAQAETLSDAVASKQPRLMDPNSILLELTTPDTLYTTNTTTKANADYGEEVFWAGEIVAWANLATATTTQTVHSAANIDLRESTLRLRALSKTSAANRDKVIYASDGYRAARDWLVETGRPWPVPATFAEPTVTTVTVVTTPGQTWWEENGLTEPPTVDEIIREMK